jgi:hypothetical protein
MAVLSYRIYTEKHLYTTKSYFTKRSSKRNNRKEHRVPQFPLKPAKSVLRKEI